jgi:anaerobic selenocysteine-containing dehydrogenase
MPGLLKERMITQAKNKNSSVSYTYEQALEAAKKNGEKVVSTLCAMCGPGASNCGVYAFVKDNRFLRVAGMSECTTNRGAVCAKGHAAPQWVYSPDRLKYPLKRTGRKGEGKFEKIAWNEAVGIIAETLKSQKEKYGPESLAVLSPANRSYNDYFRRFLTVHGSPNYGHSGICAMQRAFAFMHTIGDRPVPELDKSDLVIYWGRQPAFSSPVMAPPKMLVKAKERGAKIIAVKPSVEPDSGMADIWLPLRPGTDAALALAMLNVVINEDLIDKDFVDKWCFGYDRLKIHIQQYSPAWAEKITGVPEGLITDVARMYAKTEKAAIDLGNGVEHAPSSNDAIRAIAILISVTGHLDRPGCNLLNIPSDEPGAMPKPSSILLRERHTYDLISKLAAPEFPKQFQPFVEGLTSAYYPVLETVLTGKPYSIRSIMAPGTQPSVSTRGSRKVIEALKKVDFYVVIDVMRTADMDYADIVLPVATPYETDHPFEPLPNLLIARNKVIEPLGEYKSMYEFVLDLGSAMGYGTDFWNGSMTDCLNDQLKPFGTTIDGLRARPTGIAYPAFKRTYENYEKAFKRKSFRLSGEPFLTHGRVEIYNVSFEKEGFTPLPEWREPPESLTGTPELAKKYPLVLSDYHTSKNYTASWLRNVPYLRELQPHPAVHIHPDTAAARGIADGEWVIVESPHCRLKVKAELYPGIRPDTVMLLHGWWQGCKELGLDDMPLLEDGANANSMYNTGRAAYDPLITAMSSQTLVEIRKA